MNKYYEEILEYVDSLTIIDSHEHLPGREASREHDTDILKEYLRHYFDRDLVSAGMKPADMQIVRDPRRPFGERWKMVEPYWDLARNTGYGRSLDLAVKKIYGAERIDGSTIEGLLSTVFVFFDFFVVLSLAWLVNIPWPFSSESFVRANVVVLFAPVIQLVFCILNVGNGCVIQ